MTTPTTLQLRGTDPNLILLLGPRHTTPITDDVIMSVSHRTTGGSIGVLLEPADVERLSLWLRLPDLVVPDWEHESGQTGARISAGDVITMSVWWRGSRRFRVIQLDRIAVLELRTWLDAWLLTSWSPALRASRERSR